MADMIISLAHFCDKHGPRVLLVTQSTKDSQDLLLPDYPTDSYCESCLAHFPSGYGSSRSMRTVVRNRSYVSTNYSAISYQLVTSIIRHIFSEETMSYDGRPLTFYDQTRGFNVVVGFKLWDGNARGSERRYGFVFTINSRDYAASMTLLARHWHFLIHGLERMVSFIKKKREMEIIREEAGDSYSGFASSVGNYLRGSTLKSPKNLALLTNDDLIFVRMHKWNIFLLDLLYSDTADQPEKG
ncbi:LAMI_0G12860g1_1 [Lachancea mirantina]|uniref:LAMI_0G12860g1_1 n=1 Tax=Lachancea mirantina TaxID=1230905 RepID=A0A1G4KBK2_9SACH|nr:LAMI_0G12860g1_1 [Lachancea mirantina]